MTGLILSLTLAGGASAPAQPPHILPYPYPGPRYPAPYPPIYNPRPYPPTYPPPVPYPQPQPHYPQPGVLTIQQFAASFQPVPGAYSVVVIHPKTGQPVQVSFHLPYSAEIPRVKSGSTWVKFDYRRADDIEIEFKGNGTVEIDYDD